MYSRLVCKTYKIKNSFIQIGLRLLQNRNFTNNWIKINSINHSQHEVIDSECKFRQKLKIRKNSYSFKANKIAVHLAMK